jgi:hypothetical protein
VNYQDFLRSKEPRVELAGIEPGPVHPSLFPFQRDIVRWGLRLGRAAFFCDTGLGKTRMQLEWARQAGRRVLLVTPIAVGAQTIAEAAKLGLTVRRVLEAAEVQDGIQVTNYERLHKFSPEAFDAVVLDESSILKSIDGATRNLLLSDWVRVPRRLCCTATPAPNDIVELANHVEFLGLMPRGEFLATFFVHDSDESAKGGWRLKGHAVGAFYRWLARWAVYVRRPSDLGHDDAGYELPPLSVRDEVVRSNWRPDGQLFATGIGGIGERAGLRRHTIESRVARAGSILTDNNDQWVVWCGLNGEQDALARRLGAECVSISGADSEAQKIEKEARWRRGEARVLLSKGSIFGWGMNWQHCHRVLFLGIGDSYESYYQSIRRCYRYGQRHPVDVRIVVSEVEGEIANNVKAKEREAERTAREVIAVMREVQMEAVRGVSPSRYEHQAQVEMEVPLWLK